MKRVMTSLLGVALVAGTALSSAHAEGSVWDKENWLIRVRAIDIDPDVDSTTSIGGTVDADFQMVPELDITYFWTDHIATELILATSPHDVKAKNTALGNLDLGDVWVLPPTLTLQYHFMPDQQFRPYIGAGVNYTIYYNEDPKDVARIKYDDNFGIALQAGFDYGLDEHWAINLDVKKIYVDADASINNGAVTADVDLDPWVFGLGVAYRF